MANTPNGIDDHQHIRLACQACQRKKIKCDRNFPCGQCLRSSLQCVASTRKPRTRHVSKRTVDSELRNRISKLESLVESLSGEVGFASESVTRDARASVDPAEAPSPTAGKYIGSPFWCSLTTEVQGLRDALEEADREDEAEGSSPTTSASGNQQPAVDYELMICPPGAIYVMPGALDEPSTQMQSVLYGAFIQNVVAMFRLFHAPTLQTSLERGTPYMGQDISAPSYKALRAAMWFGAVNTLSDGECLAKFGHSRLDLMRRYKRIADVLFSQAGLFTANDLVTLQAFIVYLICSRMTDPGRRTWTLVSVAVRIARGMDLDNERAGRSPFENEIRRRVWHQLRFLDVYAALDRGTEVLIQPGSYNVPLPNNVNDSEFDESSTFIPNHENGLTDMAFPLLAFGAADMTQRLNTAESVPQGDTWQHRLELAEDFGKKAHDRFARYCDMSIPFHRLIAGVCKSMSASMVLRAVRPIQRHVSSVPPRVDSPYVLQMACDTLSANDNMYQDPEGERWRWLIWVQWHALAVALAGLCSIRGTELAETAWIYTERAYNRYEKYVADTKNGMLWRPIEKLYKKALAFREEGRRESMTSPPTTEASVERKSHGGRLDTRVHRQEESPSAKIWPLTTAPAAPPQSILNHNNLPMGALPIDHTFSNLSMEFGSSVNSPSIDTATTNIDSTLAGMMPVSAPYPPGDMAWMDWERIMDDLSGMPMDGLATAFPLDDVQSAQTIHGVQSPPVPINIGNSQRPPIFNDKESWPCELPPDLM